MAIVESALLLGLQYAMLALGVYITFRVLNIPDLTVDGSFTLGAAVSAVLGAAGHPYLGLLVALACGALAGGVTGFLQTKAGIPVYGSDPVMVQSGALACVSVSNTQLGERSAEMADEILRGKPVSEVPAEALQEFQYVIGREAAAALNVTGPEGDNYQVIG